MTGLSNPDRRRALRSIVDAVVLLALVVLLFVLTGKLSGNPEQLLRVAIGALIILGLGTLFYGAENVTRAIKFTGPLGTSAEFEGDPVSKAADQVAGAAVDAAAEVKGAAK